MGGNNQEGNPMERICPNCRCRIATEDINVSKDIALCRSLRFFFCFFSFGTQPSAAGFGRDAMSPVRSHRR